MSTFYDEIFVEVSEALAMKTCKKAVAELGWGILNESEKILECKEVTSNSTSYTWPARVKITISRTNTIVNIAIDGSIYGWGVIQSGHIKGQVGRLKNLIELNLIALPDESITHSSQLSEEIEKLFELYKKGALTEIEFQKSKDKLLNKY